MHPGQLVRYSYPGLVPPATHGCYSQSRNIGMGDADLSSDTAR